MGEYYHFDVLVLLLGDAGDRQRCLAPVTGVANYFLGGWTMAERGGLPGRGDQRASFSTTLFLKQLPWCAQKHSLAKFTDAAGDCGVSEHL